MMGSNQTQKSIFHTVQLEDLVPEDHPLRKIRPLVDTERIRELCKEFYCADNGRPSIPPEQLFLAMLGGYLLGARSDRRIIMELQCNMAFRWFVGLDIDSKVWDDTTFSKTREHRCDDANIFETLFDDTVKRAVKHGWVSDHWSMDGTLVRLSPNSSITFNEFNMSTKEFLIYSRVNYGNVLWLSRQASEVEVRDLRETDSMFSLLLIPEIDEWLSREKELDENDLYESLTRAEYSKQYDHLNKLIKENNEWISKPTKFILSMPNGLVTGQNLSMEFVVLLGNKSFLKQRGFDVYNSTTTTFPEGEYITLGFDKAQPYPLSPNTWYEVDFRGKNIEKYEGDLLKSFQIGELVTKRIPTIMTARELWLRKFSRC